MYRMMFECVFSMWFIFVLLLPPSLLLIALHCVNHCHFRSKLERKWNLNSITVGWSGRWINDCPLKRTDTLKKRNDFSFMPLHAYNGKLFISSWKKNEEKILWNLWLDRGGTLSHHNMKEPNRVVTEALFGSSCSPQTNTKYELNR